ncbi:MAG: hypothetical protein OSB58_08465 [Alphaproteobacteria bacterium]|nr:hypothetical protein [Alphaproteobacteria bacterium]
MTKRASKRLASHLAQVVVGAGLAVGGGTCGPIDGKPSCNCKTRQHEYWLSTAGVVQCLWGKEKCL